MGETSLILDYCHQLAALAQLYGGFCSRLFLGQTMDLTSTSWLRITQIFCIVWPRGCTLETPIARAGSLPV